MHFQTGWAALALVTASSTHTATETNLRIHWPYQVGVCGTRIGFPFHSSSKAKLLNDGNMSEFFWRRYEKIAKSFDGIRVHNSPVQHKAANINPMCSQQQMTGNSACTC
jgi:hypothetical protein